MSHCSGVSFRQRLAVGQSLIILGLSEEEEARQRNTANCHAIHSQVGRSVAYSSQTVKLPVCPQRQAVR
jgi:hypothetical protein